ncbi:hypothetical protein Dcar01_02410 [Deinococcus carri]|uniref:Uncharacterized protein n=1 Tax=Deinococcus carri TaxID=1211323 RepID=A0ABP9W9H4_9DEIO
MNARFPKAIAHILLLLAVFLLAPVSKPSLWLLDEWGDFRLPFFLWPGLLLLTGLSLLRAHGPRRLRRWLFAAFVILVTFAAAAYLAQGWNGLTCIAVGLAYHCGRTSLDAKAYQDEQERA